MTTRTVAVPADLWQASTLAQNLVLRLLLQHADTDDGTVCISPNVMKRYHWWDPMRLAWARKECERRGWLQRVEPYRPGTKARYRLVWLGGAA